MELRNHRSILELLHLDDYTPRELSTLLDINEEVICQAAFRGELRAKIIGHDIVRIRREDALEWLTDRSTNKG